MSTKKKKELKHSAPKRRRIAMESISVDDEDDVIKQRALLAKKQSKLNKRKPPMEMISYMDPTTQEESEYDPVGNDREDFTDQVDEGFGDEEYSQPKEELEEEQVYEGEEKKRKKRKKKN